MEVRAQRTRIAAVLRLKQNAKEIKTGRLPFWSKHGNKCSRHPAESTGRKEPAPGRKGATDAQVTANAGRGRDVRA